MRSVVFSIALAAPMAALGADVDLFNPGSSSVFGVGTLQGESPYLVGEGGAGALLTSFAQDPVVQSFGDGKDDVSAVAVLLPVTLYGGYTVAETVRVDLMMPIYPFVDAPIQDFRGPAAGDFRIQAIVPVYTEDASFAVAFIPKIALPTGTAEALTRQGFQGGLTLALGGELEDLQVGYLANAGITGSTADELGGVGLGSSVDIVLGTYYRATEAFRFGGEIDVRAGLVQGEAGSNTTSGMHFFANNVLENGFGMTLGAGSGLVAGLGSPDYRVFAGFSYVLTERDKDRDGIVDKDDVCPTEPEDLDGYDDLDGCPDPDNDGDGVADVDDACPNTPEDFDNRDDGDGCPDPDNDGDRLADADDLCPDDPGPETTGGCPDLDNDGVADKDDTCAADAGPPESEGCPDLDGDLVPDFRDSCKTEDKPESEPADISDGCPKEAWFTETGIVFTGNIVFSNGRSSIRSSSNKLLDTIAALIVATPDAGRVEVQGHTDNTGNDDDNVALSQARADRVRDYLITKSVAENRLTSKGYGQTKPIGTNRTEKGRMRNRRMAFERLEPATEAVVAPEPTAPVAEVRPGFDPNGEPGALSVVVAGGGWANVYVDGDRLTKGAPFTGQPIKAGKHKIWVANERLGIDYTEEIDVGNGKTVRIEVSTVPEPEIQAPSDDPWGIADQPPAPAPAPAPAPVSTSPWGDLSSQVEEIEDVDEEPTATGRFSKRKKK